MSAIGLAKLQGEIDVISSSLENLMTVVFPKSRSASYDAAVSIARYAVAYSEQVIGNSTFHFASFGKNQEQAARALSVIRLLRGIKGFQIFTGGAQAKDAVTVERVVSCYLDATGCNNAVAHCAVMVKSSKICSTETTDDNLVFIGFPFGLEATEAGDCIEFPCRYLAFSGFKINPLHPANIPEQIQAGGIRTGCGWCPNFPHD